MSKKLLVTGSLAYDRIAVFRDRFSAHILPDKIHRLNVSFLVDDMTVNLGGTGGNIAYSLALLGEKPLLLGAVGDDFDVYEAALKKNGILLKYLKRVPGLLTAHATIMTDLEDNQIASFYPGANARAGESSVEAVTESIALAIIAPNDKKAMLRYAEACRERNIPFIADPGQMILAMGPKELKEFIRGARGLVANDYEWQLIRDKLKVDEISLAKNLDWLIITYADKGSRCFTGGTSFTVPAYPAKNVVDPTGCGDAFRAGLMVGLKNGYPLEAAVRMGAYLASKAVEKAGTQNHTLDKSEWKEFITSVISSAAKRSREIP